MNLEILRRARGADADQLIQEISNPGCGADDWLAEEAYVPQALVELAGRSTGTLPDGFENDCPGDEEINAFMGDSLPITLAISIALHIARCPKCSDVFQSRVDGARIALEHWVVTSSAKILTRVLSFPYRDLTEGLSVELLSENGEPTRNALEHLVANTLRGEDHARLQPLLGVRRTLDRIEMHRRAHAARERATDLRRESTDSDAHLHAITLKAALFFVARPPAGLEGGSSSGSEESDETLGMSLAVRDRQHREGETFLEVIAHVRGPHGKDASCRFDILVSNIIHASYELRANDRGRINEQLPFMPVDADASALTFRLVLLS